MAVDLSNYTDATVQRYVQGETLEQIASSLGVTKLTLSRRWKKLGFTWRRRGVGACAVPVERRLEVVERYADGESMAYLARDFGVSDMTIKAVLSDHGIPSQRNIGVRHGNWAGGRTEHDGYVFVLVRDDDLAAPMRNSTGYVAEHRYVMAHYLGRPLLSTETVHHVNGCRDDNLIENLQLRFGHHGKGVAAVCAACGSCDVTFVRLG